MAALFVRYVSPASASLPHAMQCRAVVAWAASLPSPPSAAAPARRGMHTLLYREGHQYQHSHQLRRPRGVIKATRWGGEDNWRTGGGQRRAWDRLTSSGVVRWSSSSPPSFKGLDDKKQQVDEKDEAVTAAAATKPEAVVAKKRWGLREFTMLASFICAIDCTVFPVLLTVLPAAEMITPENSELIHKASHIAALYVVLPIGTTTTVTNYILHRNASLTALSTLGLSLILGSNADFAFLPSIFHESRMMNTIGCAMLIGSSYLGHRHGGDDHHLEGGEKVVPSCHGGAAKQQESHVKQGEGKEHGHQEEKK